MDRTKKWPWKVCRDIPRVHLKHDVVKDFGLCAHDTRWLNLAAHRLREESLDLSTTAVRYFSENPLKVISNNVVY